MKTNLLKKTTLLLFALLAMGGSSAWAASGSEPTNPGTQINVNSEAVKLNLNYGTVDKLKLDGDELGWVEDGSSITFNLNIQTAQKYIIRFKNGVKDKEGVTADIELKNSSNELKYSKAGLSLPVTEGYSNYYNLISVLTDTEILTGEYTLKFTFHGTTKNENFKDFYIIPQSVAEIGIPASNIGLQTKSFYEGIKPDSEYQYGSITNNSHAVLDLNVASAGDYMLVFFGSNANQTDASVTMTLSNEERTVTKYTKKFTLTNTGSYNEYLPYMDYIEGLEAGRYILTLFFEKTNSSCNYKNLYLVAKGTSAPPYTALQATGATTLSTVPDGGYATTGGGYLGQLQPKEVGGVEVGKLGYVKNNAYISFKLINFTRGYFIPSFDIESYYSGGNVVLSITDGESEIYNSGNIAVTNTTTITFPLALIPVSDDLKATFTFTRDDGNYITNAYNFLMTADETSTVSYTIPASGVGTYCSEYPLDFTETDVKAYKASVNAAESKVTLTKVDVVPAGEGVILYCETAGTYAIPVTEAAASDVTGNAMKGVLERTQVLWNPETDVYNYILQQGQFNKANDGYLKANRAYLQTSYNVDAEARALEIVFDEGETTSLREIRNEELGIKNAEFFNLNGQRVAQPTKGLYIVNGRKVVIR